MLALVVRQSVRHPWMVLTAAVMLLMVGGLSLRRAPYDVFPDFVPPQATVQTEAPGFVPEQVEALVTHPLESVINGANGVESVRSESIQGLSVITIVFKEGSDPYRARQVVAEALGDAAARLPVGVGPPTLTPLTSSTMDLLKIGFTSSRLSPIALRDLVQWTVRQRLLSVPGVARATVFGGAQRRIEIRVRPTDLIARNLSLNDLGAAIQASAAVRGGGFADTPSQRILVQPDNGAVTAKSLANSVLMPLNGGSLRLGDVADVVDAPAPQFGDALIMGKPGVLLALSSQYGANTLDTTLAVEKALDDMRPALAAQGVTLYPALHRPANFIQTALAGIRHDLLIGGLLIAFVLIAFMRSLRVALIAFLSIPLSLLAAMLVLDHFGQTINTMTLGGLAVALGVVIDDAIVDIENIARRLRLAPPGLSRAAVVEAASVEVRAPVVYATWVLLLTMAPILLLTGLHGAFFRPLALAFALAVLASLLVAVSVTPALAFLLLGHAVHPKEPRFIARIKGAHERLVRRLCAHPRPIAAATALTGIIGGLLFLSLGNELLPAFRERHYVLQVLGPNGASMDWMRRAGGRISHDLLALPQVATVTQQIGRAEAGEDTFLPNHSEFHVKLKPVDGAGEEAAQAGIRKILSRYPGIQSEVLTFLGDRIGESLSGETAAVAISIYGADLDTLDRVAGDIAQVVGAMPGAADVQVKAPAGTPILRIRLDPNRMALHGITATDAYDAIEIAFQGHVVTQASDADRTVDIALALPPALRQDPESIGAMLVRASDGNATPLSAIATIREEEGRSTIVHESGQRRQVVTLNPTGSDVSGFVHAARARIAAQVHLPPGVYLDYAGAAEGQAAASNQLMLNIGFAAIAMIALLALAFGGGRPTALILSSTPFALAGGVVAVLLTGGVVSLGALVGFVTLFGIAARNAILLLSHADHLVEAEGANWSLDTMLRATRERVTPILMTALVTALGLAPLAIDAGQAGREIQGPMAVVILGGLISSTAMSLLLLPVLCLRWRQPQ
ncbi:efflux RND transporter permease subunit [Sphingobium chungbukense]|uniref:Acriflavine resistance protein B n=1 Tax=Sphingobium chungbukense TaxID=56193 RepID=A0A0M3ASZ2_9SPHN|nr:efflux RND transporter permease subunit [Sphingobium chungbukense]KKW93307.1 acriflavine resistance protein B [Sphingobium chungbukense]